MASGDNKAGLLYLLCLSREAMRELYEYHLQDQLSSDVTATYRLFGAEPYTFVDPHYCTKPAPLREFGALKTAQGRRRKIYYALPSPYQEIIDKHQAQGTLFGPYADSSGRYYKFETATTVTAIIPKGKRDAVEFPSAGEVLYIHHVNDKNLRRTLRVERLGEEIGNSCLLECVEEV